MSAANSPAIRVVETSDTTGDENIVVTRALEILERRLRQPGVALSAPLVVKQFLIVQIGQREHEVFCALWLDVKNRLIECAELFRGTLTHTSVYPREVAREALRLNAASVIFAHNHPSGEVQPSAADIALTTRLKEVLDMIDVRALDHIVVSGTHSYSFAENGRM
jgi:DNA repair protein RadC